MKSNNSGASKDYSVKDFDARYRDANGKLLWSKLTEDIVASGQRAKSFQEAARELRDWHQQSGVDF